MAFELEFQRCRWSHYGYDIEPAWLIVERIRSEGYRPVGCGNSLYHRLGKYRGRRALPLGCAVRGPGTQCLIDRYICSRHGMADGIRHLERDGAEVLACRDQLAGSAEGSQLSRLNMHCEDGERGAA
jgi:hypothetical protein